MTGPSPATFARLIGRQPTYSVAGGIYDILAGGDETGDQWAVFHVYQPAETGPPPHTHTREDEAFYVLGGEVTFNAAGRLHVLRAGGFLHIPRGVEHWLRVTGEQAATMLVWVVPAGLERFFREVGEPLPAGARAAVPITDAHLARIMEVAPRYGLRIRIPD